MSSRPRAEVAVVGADEGTVAPSRAHVRLSTLLKVSRPGLWFPTLWLYFAVLPRPLPVEQVSFWLGLGFVTFPLNFVVYGWNDTMEDRKSVV